MNLRIPGVALLVSVALLGGFVLGAVDAPRGAGPATVGAGPDLAAGGSTCVSGGGDVERGVDVVLAAPPDGGGEGALSGRGVLLSVDEEMERVTLSPYAQGSVDVVRTELGADGWSWTGWADRPLVTWREWRSPGGPGEPRGSVVARCIDASAPRWVILGLHTDGGNEASIDITNPYTADATFALTLVTEAEALAPVALRNVSVPAGSRVSVRINDHLPEQSDIGAVVSVGAGRLAVEGLQRSTAGVGGIEGVSTIPALTEPAVAWTFPWVEAGPAVDGVVWIHNPEPRRVLMEAVVHTRQGSEPAESVESIEVDAGAFVRIDAADLVPGTAGVFGLTLRSQTTGVYVAAGARYLSDDPALTGLVGFVASSEPDGEWLDAGSSVPGRRTVLHVVNLAEVPADLRITLTTAEILMPDPADGGLPGEAGPDGTLPADTGESERSDLLGATGALGAPVITTLEPGLLAPGAVARITLPLEGRGIWSAVVHGGEALVVSRTSSGVDLLEPITIDAVPSRAWQRPPQATRGRWFDGWVARLGTSGDLSQMPSVVTRPEDILPGARLPEG